MWLILLSYLLMASTFTAAKTSVFYMKPIFFVAFRMIIAGLLLFSYIYWFAREKWRIHRSDLKLLFSIVIFHIYIAYIFEFWALSSITSSKACLLYSLSPFITALLCYLFYDQRLSLQKWFAMILGFCAMIPILVVHSAQEESLFSIGFLSLAEIAMLIAVAASAYGWILMKELINREYSPVMINGFGMLGGGILALMTAFYYEGGQPFLLVDAPQDKLGQMLLPHLGVFLTTITMAFGCMAFLILIANIIGYNLYGYLLRHYSPTFLAFAGFITPFFTGIFGWFFLSETLSLAFLISFGLTIISLYIFYKSELYINVNGSKKE